MSGSDEAVALWLSKAEAALASARSERAAGRFDFAVNRAYYAAFYGATGVLLAMGMRFAKHSGVRRAIHRDLVKAGRLPTERGHAFDQLFKSRQTADYLDFTRFTPEEVDSLIAEAEASWSRCGVSRKPDARGGGGGGFGCKVPLTHRRAGRGRWQAPSTR